MDIRILAARRPDGLIPVEHLRRFGVAKRAVAAAVTDGGLVRVRAGVYAVGTEWSALDPSGRHRLLAVAGASAVGPLSHLSAAAVHGLPLVACRTDRVHRLAPAATGGSSAPHTVLHRGRPDPTAALVDGVQVTGLERTLVDVAAAESMETAIPMLDAALFRGATTLDRLLVEWGDRPPARGPARALERLRFASPLANRPGESLSRVRIHQLGFAPPVLQHRFDLGPGRRYDVDFWWPDASIVGEFDGAAKYTRDEYRRGRTPAEVVLDEKRREDHIRGVVARFGRWEWATLWDAPRFRAQLTALGVPVA